MKKPNLTSGLDLDKMLVVSFDHAAGHNPCKYVAKQIGDATVARINQGAFYLKRTVTGYIILHRRPSLEGNKNGQLDPIVMRFHPSGSVTVYKPLDTDMTYVDQQIRCIAVNTFLSWIGANVKMTTEGDTWFLYRSDIPVPEYVEAFASAWMLEPQYKGS